MRTKTLTLEDDVAAMLDRAREEKGRSVKMLVNRALRRALSARASTDGQPNNGPAAARALRPATFQTLVKLISRHTGVDDAFANDLEEIRQDQPRLAEDPWA